MAKKEREEEEEKKHARGGGIRARARGGRTEPSSGKPKEDERTREMVAEEKEGRKFGGKVRGAAPRAHLGRRARGGRMTPKSPFSGADVKHMPYESTLKGIDEGGGGKGGPRP